MSEPAKTETPNGNNTSQPLRSRAVAGSADEDSVLVSRGRVATEASGPAGLVERPPHGWKGVHRRIWNLLVDAGEIIEEADRIVIALSPALVEPASASPAPTDAPTNDGRLMLNAYGRQCWNAGLASASPAPACAVCAARDELANAQGFGGQARALMSRITKEPDYVRKLKMLADALAYVASTGAKQDG